MKKDPRVQLVQILERLKRIEDFTSRGKEAFFSDVMIQDAVIRNLEVIGEAAKRIPDEFRKTHPQIPWRGLAALRDVLIHQYEDVSLHEVWRVIEANLPPLKTGVESILPPLDQLEREIAGESPPVE